MSNLGQNYLELNGYEFIDTLQENLRKKVTLTKVRKARNYYIVKSIDNDSPIQVKNNFAAEVLYYKNHQKHYLPKFIYSNEQLLIIEFIEGQSLRDALKTNCFDKKTLEVLVKNIEYLYRDSKIENDGSNSFKNAYRNLSNLIQSGPVQNNQIELSAFTKISNKVMAFILKIALTLHLLFLDKRLLKANFVHGDFHFNNIIIERNSCIKFIDFENVKFDGFFDFDVMYLLAMIEINLVSGSEEMIALRKALKQLLQNRRSIKIYSIFRYSVSLNKRFLT